MKYGIKHNNGTIKAVTQFNGDIIAGFIEITKEKYDEFIEILNTKTYVVYDETKNVINIDSAKENAIQENFNKQILRSQLKQLSIEIDLKKKLEEDTTQIESEFNDLAVQYRGQNPA